MAKTDDATFPYEIHELANLGEMQEQAIQELEDDIRRYGFNPDFAIKLLRGKALDGRHRQEACVRIIAADGFLKLTDGTKVTEPPVERILPRGGAAAYVAQVNSLKTYRKIDAKARMIYAAENFSHLTPNAAQKLLGFSNGQYGYILKAYKKSRRSKLTPNPWDEFKAGGTQEKLFKAFGIERTNGGGAKGNTTVLKAALTETNDELEIAKTDLEQALEQVSSRDTRIKELEKRVKSLDPQERIARAAEGAVTNEDRLRDRLEFAHDEVKKLTTVNKKLAERVRSVDRLEYVTREVLSEYNWNERTINPPVLSQGERKTRPHQFVALMSDAHYGEVVNPDEALGIKYNCDIAKRRIEHYRDMLIRFKDLREPSYDIEKLTVAVLGDMLSGNIHEELENTNERNITEQMAEMNKILYDTLVDLSQYFPEVEMVIIPGNHPRVHKKPQNKEKWDNFEYSMGLGVKNSIDINPNITNVTVTVPKDIVHVHDVYDYKIGMMHGDGAKSSSYGGIPFYGLMKKKDKLQALFAERGTDRLDMIVMGHFHQHIYLGAECDMLVNGAIKGADEYSINNFHSATAPTQVLLEFHPEHGLAAQEHINLEHIT